MATKAKSTQAADPLAAFNDATRGWFGRSFAGPTPAQTAGWPKIASGANTLICAPTGSGKTLAAFLWGIDAIASRPERLGTGVQLVYVSPLKALSYDVERNLRAPLAGIGADITIGLRTGDTPQKERQGMLRNPPDILITTPESLYLMLTSRAKEILVDVNSLIVDEIHAVAPTKRGAHMALTLERLDHHVQNPPEDLQEKLFDPGAEREPLQRIGLSATQRPLERIAKFLVGPGRECQIVDAGVRKQMDLQIVVPVEDMADPGATAYNQNSPGMGGADGPLKLPANDPALAQPPGGEKRSNGGDQAGTPEETALAAGGSGKGSPSPRNAGVAGEGDTPLTGPAAETLPPDTLPGPKPGTQPGDSPTSNSIWPAIYPELLRLVREHTSTIIFVNNRRGAERMAKRLNEMVAEEVATQDPEGTEPPPEIARAHHGSLAHEERIVVEEMLKSGSLPCLVATSSLELGIDMGAVNLVIQ
ncbi:MAG: DEAD/DEAH box helicase, partial [Solirubrobacterales bacterium]